MEPLYQNRYVITKEQINEFYIKCFPILSIVYYPLILLITGIFLYIGFEGLHYLIFTILLSLSFTYINYSQTRKSITYVFERLLLNKADDLERIIEFADCITINKPSTGGRDAYDYHQIKKLIISKSLFILILPAQLSICVEKGKFTIGKEDAFLTFLQSKCPRVKLK